MHNYKQQLFFKEKEWEKGHRKADWVQEETELKTVRLVDAHGEVATVCDTSVPKMVRSLVQWTKTLSFPARISPNKSSKESVLSSPGSPTITPTPSNMSLSPPCKNEINNMKNSSLNEVNQVSAEFSGCGVFVFNDDD